MLTSRMRTKKNVSTELSKLSRMEKAKGVVIAGMILLALLPAAWAGTTAAKPQALLGSRIRYAVPSGWVETRRNDSKTVAAAAFRIPNGKATASANAAVVVREAKDETLEGYARSWIESSRVVHGAVVLNRFEGGSPVSDVFVLYRMQQNGVPYLAADRYSSRGGLLLQVRIAWPVLKGESADWRRTILASSNRLLSEVAIDGAAIGPLGLLREADAATGAVEAVRAPK